MNPSIVTWIAAVEVAVPALTHHVLPRVRGIAAVLGLLLFACACSKDEPAAANATTTATPMKAQTLDALSEAYVRLALAWGEHDADYVDAYYGPPQWREEAKREAAPVAQLRERAQTLAADLSNTEVPADKVEAQRRVYLIKQLDAMRTRIEMLAGTKLPFDVESQRVFDAQAPTHNEAYFADMLKELDAALPGRGSTSERYVAYRNRMIIPPAKLDAVFKRAVAACRERTLAHITLPPEESFTIEYVTKKPWSGYNWYQGGYRSLIQVNTDLPIYIDRALDLACHEGYPGHHVYATLLEKHLARERHWQEFTISPLFSPQALIGEGSANYGIELAFPGDERWQFERDVLYPLAGLDAKQAERYYRITRFAAKLEFAGNEAARQYLDGKIDAKAATTWLERYGLMSPERARQRVKFIDTYRAYVINYNLGLALVRQHVEAVGGVDANARWKAFEELVSTPQVPSGLRK
jgi:hypothetical protein